ncbi:MAG: aminoacetone oxidase family FAD-binding enzyme [Bacilli bacterium]|nr:aminoacetone oxidase family FAD-binding enzyme [Bacilli bacterium]MDD3895525.1 aminoacetone oxidase family FAD-binding enzyme [Bacilli bacterium]MDD4407579.1 aminoacetone oxidase family FAD-binding enzyme [Bacilli bacterium]
MFDCIIIGAGPAGLMAAIKSSQNNKVLLIDKNSKPGKKLLLTGGGRCNLTNLKTNNEFLNEVNYNKKYLYSAINIFGPNEIYNYFETRNVPLKIEEDNKVFPESNQSVDVLNVLLNELKNVPQNYNETVLEIKNAKIKEVVTNKNIYQTKNIIIATGGSSFKYTGSTGDNMKFAHMLKQPTIKLFPAETGVKLIEQTYLAGTSILEVTIYFENKKSTGNLMFTHLGLGGSAIMKLSEFIYKSSNKDIKIDLLPNFSKEELLTIINNYNSEKNITSLLNNYFTKKFSLYLVNKININKRIKSLTKTEKEIIINILKELRFEIKEVNELETAYVTGGGIDLKYINSMTMESTINRGIYFIGEALDTHGPIGGYNITLALSTGYLAGLSINKEDL